MIQIFGCEVEIFFKSEHHLTFFTVVSSAEKIFLKDCSKVAGVILPTSINFIDISLAIFRMVSSVTVPDWSLFCAVFSVGAMGAPVISK